MNTLDRLYLAKWVKPTFGALVTFVLLFLLVDVFGLVEDLIANWAGTTALARYLLFRTGYAIFFLSPMAFLIGGFWMSQTARRQQEWTVSLLGGRSPLYLLRAPVLTLAGATVLLMAANVFLMPYVSSQVENLREFTFEGKSTKKTIYRQIHLRLVDDRTVRIEEFSPTDNTIEGITVSTGSGANLTSRIDAESGTYRPGSGWNLESVNVRTFDTKGNVTTEKHRNRILPMPPPRVLDQVLTVDPGRSGRQPVEYSYRNLNQAIQFKHKRRMNAVPEKIFLHWKFGFPLTNLVLGLLGLAVGFRTNLGRAGGIGLCLLTGFGYWILYSFAVSLGKSARVSGFGSEYVHLAYVYGPPLIVLVGTYLYWKRND